MDRVAPLFSSDAIPLAILALILVEGVVLLVFTRRPSNPQRGVLNTSRIVSFLGAGASLIVAMMLYRGPHASPAGFALAMLCALVFHLWHITSLLQR